MEVHPGGRQDILQYYDVYTGGELKGRVCYCLGTLTVVNGRFNPLELLEVREKMNGYPEAFYDWAKERGFIYAKVGISYSYYNKYFSGGSVVYPDELFKVFKTCPDKYAHYPRK